MVEQYTYTSADLPAHLKCQVLSFLRVQWPEGFIGENRLRDWITKESDHPLHMIFVEADILVSHTNVVWKYLNHAGVTYKTYGLTGVFCYPAFRSQGYGGRVVSAATAYIQSSDADIAMFHCDPALRAFYVKYGWEPFDQAATYIGPQDAPIRTDELLMMQFLSSKGLQGKTTFADHPIHFGSDSTW